MAFSIPMPASSSDPEMLTYRLADLEQRQARFRGREVLRPDLDLSAFMCRAVIDWLDVKLTLGRATQWKHLQSTVREFCGRTPHVTGPEGETRHTGESFIVRIQEAELPVVAKAVEAVRCRWGLACEPEVVGLEVSIDFYPHSTAEADRRKMVSVLMRHLFPREELIAATGTQPRFSWARQRSEIVLPGVVGYSNAKPSAVLDQVANRPMVEATYYIGKQNGPVMIRVMEKVRDRQAEGAGTGDLLREAERRARVEVALKRPELERLGIRSLADLRAFRFTKLQGRYFRFMLPTLKKHAPGGDPISLSNLFMRKQVMEHFRRSGVVGVRRLETVSGAVTKEARRALKRAGLSLRARTGGVGGDAGTLVAFAELNKKVEAALRHLAERS